MSQQFYLSKSGARDSVIRRIATVLSKLPMDRAWTLDLKEFKPRRSDQQNRYLWGVVYGTILKALGPSLQGWDSTDLHEYLLGEWAGWERLEGLGRVRLRPVKRSSRLSKVEFMDYVAWIQQHMAEKGVYVPDPNEVPNDRAA